MANLQIRIDDALKDEAMKIAHDLGMDLTTAVKIFLKQMVRDHRLPFQPQGDPFYSKKNQDALKTSITQLDEKQLISKSLSDLHGMEK